MAITATDITREHYQRLEVTVENRARLLEKAIQRIAPQLRRDEFRFVPIWSWTKVPFERRWNVPGSDTNYSYDDPKLAAYLLAGHNFGICTGMGSLIIFDADELTRLQDLGILGKLPPTFTVRTGGGGRHQYYICRDIERKAVMYDLELRDPDHPDKPLHLGEIQTLGFQCVCPGSLHPNGQRYIVEDDLSIAEISWADLYKVLDGKVDFELAASNANDKKKHFAVRVKNPDVYDPFEDVRIEDVLYPKGDLKKHGGIVKGAHPIHGSTHGYNFQIDTSENTFFCYRCWSGGGPALAVAIHEGILRCDQCHKGALRGDLFVRTVMAAESRGYIKRRRPQIIVERWDD
jgi:hypothetical protein